MKLVTTYFAPTSVLDSFKCRFSDGSDSEKLVVARLNRIEVFDIAADGLNLIHTLPIRGKVLNVVPLPIRKREYSKILVMTDHPDPELIILGWEKEGLVVQGTLQLYEQGLRPMEYLNTVLVDPSGAYAVVCCYAGKLKIIQFTKGRGEYDSDFDVILPEMSVLALAILENSTLGIIHLDFQRRFQLVSRQLSLELSELSAAPSELIPKTIIPNKIICETELDALPYLIPVPPTPLDRGGVLVLGGNKIMYYAYSTKQEQEKFAAKKKRLEHKKQSKDSSEVQKAKEKERERDGKRRKAKASVDWPWGEISAWGPCGVPTRFLIGDVFGRLCMLSLDMLLEEGLILMTLGETSSATSLTYITSQFLYVGSHLGDSQLIQISPTPVDNRPLTYPEGITTVKAASLSGKGKSRIDPDLAPDTHANGQNIQAEGSHLVCMERFKNIAPIVDAVVIDPEESGHKAIITCSGGRNTGSIHVLRDGADFQELASVTGFENITNVWPVCTSGDESDSTTHLLLSTTHDSQLFAVEGIDRLVYKQSSLSSPGLITDSPTLVMSTKPLLGYESTARKYTDSGFFVQVTEKAAVLLRYQEALDEFVLEKDSHRWNPSSRWPTTSIVAANANSSQICLGLSNKRFTVLAIKNAKAGELTEWSCTTKDEIASISCELMAGAYAHRFAVSYWSSNSVQLFEIPPQGRLESLCTVYLDTLPRSVLLHNFGTGDHVQQADYQPHLFVGLTNGSVMSYVLTRESEYKSLEDRKCVVSFGHAPVSLKTCTVKKGAKRAVFAAGNRASLLFWDENRLKTSPVLLKNVSSTCDIVLPGDTTPRSLIAYHNGLSIGEIRDLDKMHIHSIPTGEANPRRIAHDPVSRTLAIAFNKIQPWRVGEPQNIAQSWFKLVEDTTLKDVELASYQMELFEEITAVRCLSLSVKDAGSPSKSTRTSVYYCIGTMFYDPEEVEPSHGRILLFEVKQATGGLQKGSPLCLVTACDVSGCVYAMDCANGLLVATVNSDVMVTQLVSDDSSTDKPYFLEKETDRSNNYVVNSLDVEGDTIILGDRLSSLSVLKLVEEQVPKPGAHVATDLAEGMDVDEQTETRRRLRVVARDYAPLLPVCVAGTGNGGLIGADGSMNLFSYRVVPTTGVAGDSHKLEKDGCYHAADLITKVIKGEIVMNNEVADSANSVRVKTEFQNPPLGDTTALVPSHIMFSPSGFIGVVVDVKDEHLAIQLTALERNLSTVLDGAGGESQSRYRRPRIRGYTKDKEDQASIGFIDGDFLEQFLKLEDRVQIEKVLNGEVEAGKVQLSEDAVRRVLGALQNLH